MSDEHDINILNKVPASHTHERETERYPSGTTHHFKKGAACSCLQRSNGRSSTLTSWEEKKKLFNTSGAERMLLDIMKTIQENPTANRACYETHLARCCSNHPDPAAKAIRQEREMKGIHSRKEGNPPLSAEDMILYTPFPQAGSYTEYGVCVCRHHLLALDVTTVHAQKTGCASKGPP